MFSRSEAPGAGLDPARAVVTTTLRPAEHQVRRADEVAARTGWPVVVRRRGLEALFEAHRVPVAYVVGRDREELVTADQRVAVDAGLLHAHRSVGLEHPFVRSVGPASRIIDGTLGLCRDALHLAAVTGAQVVGLEIAAPLVCLAEEGLPRLARTEPAAARIAPVHADSRTYLATLRADVVTLSPMFDEPQAAAPGFDVLRELAESAPLDLAWLEAAFTAAPRVVVKVRPGQPIPLFARPHLGEVRRGRAVDYWTLWRERPTGELG